MEHSCVQRTIGDTNCTPARALAAYHDLTWHEATQKYNQLCLVAHIFVVSTAACGLQQRWFVRDHAIRHEATKYQSTLHKEYLSYVAQAMAYV